ncbi:MAG: PEP-CTERM sorting domain-containing protein [Verrucomicrobiaceae bacterium]
MSTLAGLTAVSNAQSLGSALNYDILVLDNGQSLLGPGTLRGEVGYSDATTTDNKASVAFQGNLYVHSNVNGFRRDSGFTASGGTIYTSGYDTQLDGANADIVTFANDVARLGSTVHYGEYQSTSRGAFSYSSTQNQTILDFTKLELRGEDFTLTGRDGFDDKFIIRISSNIVFERSEIVLNNLDHTDVIWYNTGGASFDLHGAVGNFYGTIVSPGSGQVVIGDVDFTGAVIARNMKLGTDFNFTGQTTIPEPSSSVMFLGGFGWLMLGRRRKS